MAKMREVKDNDRIALLQGVWLFERCTKSQLTEIARICTPLSVDAGRVLAREDEIGNDFVVVAEGEAEASIRGAVVSKIGPGSFFGEMALLDGGPRTATVTSQTPMLLLVLDRREFDTLLDTAIPSVGRRMLTVLAERLRLADARTVNALERLGGL
jgi:CRP-like cAMP-binding protein